MLQSVAELELEAEGGQPAETLRVDYLMPGGPRPVEPGELVAFYRTMDEARWRRARRLRMLELSGAEHSVSLP